MDSQPQQATRFAEKALLGSIRLVAASHDDAADRERTETTAGTGYSSGSRFECTAIRTHTLAPMLTRGQAGHHCREPTACPVGQGTAQCPKLHGPHD